MTTNLTSRQTYKYDQFGQLRLTDMPTRQPYASYFNFFVLAQNILKFFGSLQTAHLQAAQADPQPKLAKEPFFANALFKILIWKPIFKVLNAIRKRNN
jgi:hypothetical protein